MKAYKGYMKVSHSSTLSLFHSLTLTLHFYDKKNLGKVFSFVVRWEVLLYRFFVFVRSTTIAAPKSLSNNKEFDCSTTQFKKRRDFKVHFFFFLFWGGTFLPIADKVDDF